MISCTVTYQAPLSMEFSRQDYWSGGGCSLVTKLCPTLATPWNVSRQAPLSMGFFRQEYWNGLPFPSARDLPDPGIQPRSSALQANSLPTEPTGKHRDSIKSHKLKAQAHKTAPTSDTNQQSRLLSNQLCITGSHKDGKFPCAA